jgi:hypothetical protein
MPQASKRQIRAPGRLMFSTGGVVLFVLAVTLFGLAARTIAHAQSVPPPTVMPGIYKPIVNQSDGPGFSPILGQNRGTVTFERVDDAANGSAAPMAATATNDPDPLAVAWVISMLSTGLFSLYRRNKRQALALAGDVATLQSLGQSGDFSSPAAA